MRDKLSPIGGVDTLLNESEEIRLTFGNALYRTGREPGPASALRLCNFIHERQGMGI
jgi:hypothetical protein